MFELTLELTSVGANSIFFKTIYHIFLIFNTCVNDLEKLGRDVVFALFQGNRTSRIFQIILFGFILFGEYANDERSKELHMHIGGKEAKNILDYLKVRSCRRRKLKEALEDFPVT